MSEPFKHRIRAAAIIVQDDKVLLVQHQHQNIGDGSAWWVPPGGGVGTTGATLTSTT